MQLSILALLLGFPPSSVAQGEPMQPPYPPSSVIECITWHWKTHRTAAPGSDLWPVTWGADDNLYVAWGDGGGFGGTDQDGRVALGIARLEGLPERFSGVNRNGGKDPAHRASFAEHGKTGGLLAVGECLYAWLNTQNGKWPDVDQALVWSDDKAATWKRSEADASKKAQLRPRTSPLELNELGVVSARGNCMEGRLWRPRPPRSLGQAGQGLPATSCGSDSPGSPLP